MMELPLMQIVGAFLIPWLLTMAIIFVVTIIGKSWWTDEDLRGLVLLKEPTEFGVFVIELFQPRGQIDEQPIHVVKVTQRYLCFWHKDEHVWIDRRAAVPVRWAVTFFTRRLRVRPDDVWALASRGIAHSCLGQLDPGYADLTRALDLKPDQPHVWFQRGLIEDQRGNFQEAVADFSEAVRLNPCHAAALAARGNVIWKSGNRPQGVADIEQAYALDPSDTDVNCFRGYVLLNDEDFDGALAHFNRALRYAPRSHTLRAGRARAWQGLGQLDKALDDAGQAPLNAENLVLYAQILFDMEQYDRAAQVLNRAETEDPHHVDLHALRYALHSARKEFAKALAALERAEQVGASKGFVLRGRGHIAHKQAQYAEALSYFEEALRAEPDDKLARNNVAWILGCSANARFRDGERAVELARAVCERTRWQNPLFIDTLAVAHAERGDFEQAVTFQEQAVNSPKFPAAVRAGALERLELFRQRLPYRESFA